jgi:manganese/iron transport system permease protein
MIDLSYFAPVMVGGAVAGASTGLLGTYIVGMRIPFLGVCVSHAALAGAVFGSLAGLEGSALLVPALAGAGVTALVLGLANPERLRADTNVLIGVLFGLSMGLAFLGIGLFSVLGKSDNEVRSLLWGSLNFCRWGDVALMAAVGGGTLLFLLLFYKEMRAIMFSRLHATASGIHVVGVWSAFLILASAVLTVNFQTVGGLMIYSLMVNPAAAAFQLVRGHGRALACSAALGAVSGLGGFLIAALLDLPTGAMIVILSSVLVGIAAVVARVRHRLGVTT